MPEQEKFTLSTCLPSIQWDAPSDGQRLRAEYWQRKALYWRAKATQRPTPSPPRSEFRCSNERRLIGF